MPAVFFVKLSSPIVLDGSPVIAIGPFERLMDCGKWVAENDDALNARGVKHAIADTMHSPVKVPMP